MGSELHLCVPLPGCVRRLPAATQPRGGLRLATRLFCLCLSYP